MFLWQEGKRHGVGSFSAYLCQCELLQFPLLALHLTRLRVDRASSHLGWCQVVSCIHHEQAFVLSCWLCCKPGLYRWWKWLIVTLVNVDLKASWQRFPESAGNFSSLHSTENEDPWMLLKKHPNTKQSVLSYGISPLFRVAKLHRVVLVAQVLLMLYKSPCTCNSLETRLLIFGYDQLSSGK